MEPFGEDKGGADPVHAGLWATAAVSSASATEVRSSEICTDGVLIASRVRLRIEVLCGPFPGRFVAFAEDHQFAHRVLGDRNSVVPALGADEFFWLAGQ